MKNQFLTNYSQESFLNRIKSNLKDCKAFYFFIIALTIRTDVYHSKFFAETGFGFSVVSIIPPLRIRTTRSAIRPISLV